ncbi:MAG: thioredoxin family protein [Akkermansiaceae bacterium]|nr:thioredoxin family protein [Akkermansiaceae bacterium]MDP4647674.1 thioredoxin family protein [Akkermansiaceae bacterium]MDP4722267.1 thioredoxin family protein [Akkermansiaceae bacterium]MDP4780307.1 thioredoxin family protein [Akkermansiaceae bacterium]MDP4846209.1 thioredoxin family protein [Akkermansiaceae bacterium]
MRNNIVAAAAAAVCISSALAGGEGWTSDFEAAKKKAAEENKNLLIDFTGSDWCGWCIRLKEEVFDKDEFNKGVEDKFVLVEIDFPQDDSKLSAETKAQNEKLGEEYAVQGYPTIMLTDAAGKPYAQTGYQEGGPDAYVEHLAELTGAQKSLNEALTKAEGLEGVAKAEALIAALEAVELEDGVITKFYGDQIAMIKASDPEDSTGYVKNIEAAEKFAVFENKLNELGNEEKFEEALVLVDDTLNSGDFDGDRKQNIMFIKAIILAELEKFDDSLAVIDDAKAISPDSEMAANLDQVKAHIIELKEKAAAGEDEATEEE